MWIKDIKKTWEVVYLYFLNALSYFFYLMFLKKRTLISFVGIIIASPIIVFIITFRDALDELNKILPNIFSMPYYEAFESIKHAFPALFNIHIIYIVASVCIAAYSCINFISNQLLSNLYTVENRPDFKPEKIMPDETAQAQGFIHLSLNKGNVHTSKEINRLFFTETSFQYEEKKHFIRKVRNRIKKDRNFSYRVLKWNFRNANFINGGFYNERKLCISEIDFNSKIIYCHLGTYYDTYLTNIIIGQKKVHSIIDGEELNEPQNKYPAYTYRGKHLLKPLQDIDFNNEIGISTIAFTKDQYFIMWTQSNRAQSNINQIVPTGTGSGDWDSVVNNKSGNFIDIIKQEMQREMWEESNIEKNGFLAKLCKVFWFFNLLSIYFSEPFKKFKNIFIKRSNGIDVNEIEKIKKETKTKITGYFRWLEKGGKAEFVGISKLNINHDHPILEASNDEVINGSILSPEPIKNYHDLIEYLDIVLRDKKIHDASISLPLEMCFKCLRDILGDAVYCNDVLKFMELPNISAAQVKPHEND